MQPAQHTLKRRLNRLFRPQSLAAAQADIDQWLTGSVGRYLLAQERQLIPHLPVLPGYHLLELGISSSTTLLPEFDQLSRFKLSATVGATAGAVADFEALPLPSDVLDGVIVHHALEFSRRPHVVLNEAARVVAPGGYLVLFVLNPFTLLSAARWPATLLSGQNELSYHSLRLGRMIDWLRLLHFKPMCIKRSGYGAAPESDQLSSKLERYGYGLGLPSGLFYTIVAKKQVTRPIIDRSELWNGIKISNLGWQPSASSSSFVERQETRKLRRELRREQFEEC